MVGARHNQGLAIRQKKTKKAAKKKGEAAPGHYAGGENLEASRFSLDMPLRPKKAAKKKEKSDPDGDFVLNKKQQKNKRVSKGEPLAKEQVAEKVVAESLRKGVGRWRLLNGLPEYFDREVEVLSDESVKDWVVLVTNGSEFRVSRDFVCYFSPFLRSVFEDPSTVRYVVPNTTELAVFLLIRSLKTGTLKGASGWGYEYSIRDYIDLALLANQLFVAEVQNEALEAVFFGASTLPEIEIGFHTVYEHARRGSIIREFLTNLVAVYIDLDEMVAAGDRYFERGLQAYPLEFLREWERVYRARRRMAGGLDDFDMSAYTVAAFSGTVPKGLLVSEKQW